MLKNLQKALDQAKDRGEFYRVQTNAPDASYRKSKKYFLINCQNNKCVHATGTQKEMIWFLLNC